MKKLTEKIKKIWAFLVDFLAFEIMPEDDDSAETEIKSFYDNFYIFDSKNHDDTYDGSYYYYYYGYLSRDD